MKKESSIIMLILGLLLSFILINSCNNHANKNDYLREVLDNLEQIKSATYRSTITPFAPGDTIPDFTSIRYYNEYINPSDTLVGASFLYYLEEDTSYFKFCYDGKLKASVIKDKKRILIDSLKTNKSAFCYINAPFFTRIKTLLQYTFNTKDSLLIEAKDMGDSILYCLSIYDTLVEVIGNRIIYFPSLYGSSKGEVYKYYIWINKSDGLPYRYKNEKPHMISVEAVKGVKLNHLDIKDFKVSDYFPSDFSIQNHKELKRKKPDNFLGKTAPNWVLSDTDNNTFSLEDMHSKVIMIQFTGVSCGACVASIPFLKQLETEYDKKDFDFISIECWSKSSNALLKYRNRHDINYKFIRSSKEVSKRYQIQAVPVFFILDENRIIRNVIRGYGKETIDKEIREAIDELIQKQK